MKRQADNIIIKKNQKIYKINNMIEQKNKDIKNLNNIKENFLEINKKIRKSIEILSMSVKSKHARNMYNDMYNENDEILKKVSYELDQEEFASKKKLKELYSKKNQIEQENKKKIHKKE